MISLANVGTSVRGGPEPSEEVLAGENTGQFASIFNALAIMPVANRPSGESQISFEPGAAGFITETGNPSTPWNVQPGDLSVLNSGSGISADAPPVDPEVVQIGQIGTGADIPDSLPILPPVTVSNLPGEAINPQPNDLRGGRLALPPLVRPTGSEGPPEIKVDPPPVNTPPIIVFPQGPVVKDIKPILTPPIIIHPSLPPAALQGVAGFRQKQDTAANSGEPYGFPSDHLLGVSEVPESNEPAVPLFQAALSGADPKTAIDLRLAKAFAPDKTQLEPGKLSEAIFERFAVNADKALRNTDFKMPVDAEPVIQQIEKPILELSGSVLDDGEPLILKFRLKPAELGSVEIRLERNAAGKLNVHFQTESEIASRVLNDSFDRLRHSLHENGWQVDEMNASNRPLADHSNNQRGPHEGNGHQDAATPRSENPEYVDDLDSLPETSDEHDDRLVSIRA